MRAVVSLMWRNPLRRIVPSFCAAFGGRSRNRAASNPSPAAPLASTFDAVHEPGIDITSHEQRVGGRQYLVHESGRPTGGAATVVLVHGIGMTHASRDPVQRRLPPDLRCLNVDLAGFGSTERPRRALSIEQYVADLAGRSVAFQNPYSTSAYYLPAAKLIDEGMKLEVLLSPMDRPAPGAVG